ncbi:MAG TPA: fatty acid desaturase, partial [Pseudomonadales bacterium]|nr:fatty acid desaturase [Pseudomonadales bacterium]
TADIQRPEATGWMYLPYIAPMLISTVATFLVFTNSSRLGWGLLGFLIAMRILEPILGEEHETYHWKNSQVFVWAMQFYSVGTVATFVGFLWVMAHAHNGGDLLGLAAGIQAVTGFDMMAAHANDGIVQYLIATLLFSVTSSLGTVAIGHELCHRLHEPLSVFLSRLMGTFTMFSYYAVEHPYGHHLTAATPRDSSTALRGESIVDFIQRTFRQDYEIVWEIEKNRLDNKGLPVWSHHNRLLRGFAVEAAITLLVAILGGFTGLALFLVGVALSHITYKAGVFIQHYGLVRDPNQPIEIRHSWGCTSKVTNWFTDGIGRHADHHDVPEREFWNLVPHLEGPQLPDGYLKMIGLAYNKKKWEEAMVPLLIEWDEKHASPAEKLLALAANEKSGNPQLLAHAKRQREELKKEGLLPAESAA